MKIKKATPEDLHLLHPLFAAYRAFYQRVSTEETLSFLAKRIQNQEAVVFLAMDQAGRAAKGFTLLYPSFSSLSLSRIYVLNDLFVGPQYRKQGVARQLLETAKAFAKSEGATSLSLMTHVTNDKAQNLYRSCGYRQVDEFLTFSLGL